MKKTFILSVLTVFAALSLCACGGNNADPGLTETQRPTQAPIAIGNYDFSIKNELGSSITKLYISDSSSDNWGDNLLTDENIYDGGAFEVNFSPEKATSNAQYDIAILTSDQAEYHFEGLNLTDISVVTLTWNDNDEVVAQLD